MDITLKNIEHFAKMSEETNCFSATVYVDGKKCFGVMNHGHGGDDMPYHVDGGVENYWGSYREVNAELAKEKCAPPYEDLNNDIQIVIGDLLEQWLVDKKIKSTLRNITYMVGDEVRSVKLKPSPENFERVKQQTWWKPENIILNGLPIDEIRGYFS